MKKLGKGSEWHFSKEDVQMAEKPMKRCSTLSVVMETQIKTGARCRLACIGG